MPIDTRHPQYQSFSSRWSKIDAALADEQRVKEEGVRHLPKTDGMLANSRGDAQYDAFKKRARFPEITSQAQTAVVGLVFEKDPVGSSDTIITNAGQSNLQLAREVVRAVAGKGRDVLVVDAPTAASGGGEAFIARYTAETLTNWKVSDTNPSDLTLAVFEEEHAAPNDIYGHESDTLYRRYLRLESGRIEMTLWRSEKGIDVIVGEPSILPVDFMPIVVPGSIDLLPACDPIPLMPVARCAFAYYMKSAIFEHALYLLGQPTPWVSGIDEDQYRLILEQGIGCSSLWHLGDGGVAGMLQAASDPAPIERAMDNELRQAESYAVRLTSVADDGGAVESGRALAMRAATQHASVYSMADAVSIAITAAQQMRNRWNGSAAALADFQIRTEFESDWAGEQIINALNSAANAGNAPRTPIFEAIRRSGLSELTDEQMLAEIEAMGMATAAMAANDLSDVEPVAA